MFVSTLFDIFYLWIDYAIPRCTIINELPKHNSIFCLDCSYDGFFLVNIALIIDKTFMSYLKIKW